MKAFIGTSDTGRALYGSVAAAVHAGCYLIEALDAYCADDSERLAVYLVYARAVETRRAWRGVRWVRRVGDGYELVPRAEHGLTSLPLFAAGYDVDSVEALMLEDGMSRREREIYGVIRSASLRSAHAAPGSAFTERACDAR